MHEIAGGGTRMPRFDDGMVNMAELVRVMVESLVDEIMGARADEAREAGNRRSATACAGWSPAWAPSTSGYRNWKRTDDVQERANAEIKRYTKVVSVFLSVESVGAVCFDQNDAWSHAQSLTDARSMWKGYKSPGLPAAGEEAIERVLTLVEVAFMDMLGKVA